MGTKKSGLLRNQCGAALVIALVMIVVLTLIGLASTYTSIFEVKLSGNKRGTTSAFYTAEAGGESVLASISNFMVTGSYKAVDITKLPEILKKEPIDLKFSSPTLSLPPAVVFSVNPQVTIYHTTRTDAPRGSGQSATGNYEFNHFLVRSVGNDQVDVSLLPSRCEVVEKVVRLLPSSQGGT